MSDIETTTAPIKHLWEVDHPYYCNEGNYFASGASHGDLGPLFKSFAEFLAEWGEADLDMNLVFRWDWKEDEDRPFAGDENYRNGRLLIFLMGQRKGLYNWVEVDVCRADEPAVRAYLEPRFQRMMQLWAPLSGVEGES